MLILCQEGVVPSSGDSHCCLTLHALEELCIQEPPEDRSPNHWLKVLWFLLNRDVPFIYMAQILEKIDVFVEAVSRSLHAEHHFSHHCLLEHCKASVAIFQCLVYLQQVIEELHSLLELSKVELKSGIGLPGMLSPSDFEVEGDEALTNLQLH